MRHWTCRQLLVIIALGAATLIAIKDPGFRRDYAEIVTFLIGGYLGQQIPQGRG